MVFGLWGKTCSAITGILRDIPHVFLIRIIDIAQPEVHF